MDCRKNLILSQENFVKTDYQKRETLKIDKITIVIFRNRKRLNNIVMKKITSLSIVLFILFLVTTGCDKSDPPPPPPVTYSITISISGEGLVTSDKMTGLSEGSSAVLKFTPKSGYSLYSVKLNGTKVEEIIPTDKELSYTVQAINKNIVVEAVFVETNNILISTVINKNPWKLKSMDIYKEDGNFLFSIDLPKEIIDRRTFYYFNYPYTNYIESLWLDNSQCFYADWSINQTTLRIDMTSYIILELTNTRFKYKASPVIGSDGTYTYAQYTYERN